MTYKLRIGGTSDFVSKIDPDDPTCYPPGSVDVVHGWGADCLTFESLHDAAKAAKQVEDLEGFHVSIEEITAR